MSKGNSKIGTRKIKIEGFYSKTFVESIGNSKIAIKIDEFYQKKIIILNICYK